MPIIASNMYNNAYGKSAIRPVTRIVNGILTQDAYILSYSLDGIARWAAPVVGPNGNKFLYSAAADSNGNVYVAGGLSAAGLAQLYNADGTTSKVVGNSAAAESFVAKYTSNGKVVWTARIANSGSTRQSLAVDSNGNVIVIGYSGSTTTFYSVDGTAFVRTASAGNSFVVKYNTNGVVQWVGRIVGVGGDAFAHSVSADASNDIVILGTTTAATSTTLVNANNTNGPALGANIGSTDGFIAKYTSTGTASWIARLSGGASAQAIAGGIVSDSTSAYYITGSAGSAVTTTFYNSGGTAFGTTLAAIGLRDIFLAKYSTSGSVVWVARLGGSGDDTAYSIARDSANNIYISGNGVGTTFGSYSSNNVLFSPALAVTGASVGFLVKYNSSGTVQWNAKVDGASGDIAYAVSVDSSDNVYIGSSGGVTTVHNADQTSFGTTNVLAAGCIVKYSSSGTVQWFRQLNGLAAATDPITWLNATSSSLYAVGTFRGTQTTMYGKALSLFATLPSSGLIDSFIVKYNRNGAPQWTARIASTADDTSWFTTTDSLGNMYATGSTGTGTTTYFYNADGTTFASSITSLGTDVFLVKYDMNGTIQWVASMSTTGDDTGFSAATDSSGNVYVTGTYADATLTAYNSDGSSFATTLAGLGGGDCFIAKYNSAGFVQWLTRIGSTNQDIGYGVAVDTESNLYVCGTCTGSLGGSTAFYNSNGTLFGTLTPIGGSAPDAFVTKYNSGGTCQWIARIGTTGTTDLGRGIATDSNNNVYVIGNGTGAISAYNAGGGGIFATVANIGGGDCFIAKYNSSGTGQWLVRIGNSGTDNGPSVSTDRMGNVYALCNTSTSTAGANTTAYNADGTAYPNTVFPETTGGDARVVKYNTTGVVQWILPISSGVSDASYGIKADPRGNVYVVGQFGPGSSRVTIGNADRSAFATFTESCAVVKFDTNGVGVWAQILRGITTGGVARSVSVDPFDGVYVTGTTQSGQSLAVYESDYTPYRAISGTRFVDIFLAKYSKNAEPLWISKVAGEGASSQIHGIATDSTGSVYAATSTTNIITVLNANGTNTTITRGGTNTNATLVKYTPAGLVEWSAFLVTTGGRDVLCFGLTRDSGDNIYIIGHPSGTTTMEARSPANVTGATVACNNGSSDVFMFKYNASGTALWGIKIASTGADIPYGVSTDSSGNIYVTGSYSGTLTAFNSDTTAFATTLPVTTATDIFLVKYNSAGFVQWVTSIRTAGTTDIGYGVSADSSGNVYVATQTANTVTAYNADGSASALPTIANSGGTDGILVKYNTSGTAQWMARVASTNTDSLRSVTVSSSGDVYVTGNFLSTVSISNAGDGTSVFGTFTSIGAADTLVVKYNSSGTVQWAARLASTVADSAYGIRTDSNGNLYVTGQAGSSQEFTAYNADGTLFGSINASPLTPAGTSTFLIKYNSLGVVQWLTGLGGPLNDEARVVTVDPLDNVLMAGTLSTRQFIPQSS